MKLTLCETVHEVKILSWLRLIERPVKHPVYT